MSAIMASTVCVKTMADDTLRLTIDIEPQYAGEAFALFGKRGMPCAIARLTNESAVEAMQAETVAVSEEKPRGGPLAKLAGMWCNDPSFWRWAYKRHGAELKSALDAAVFIRGLCLIGSRAELDSDSAAAQIFHEHIREPYRAYLAAMEPGRVSA